METVRIALTFEDGSVGVMLFVTVQPPKGSRPGWRRDPTPQNVELTIAQAAFPQAVTSWRILARNEELPDRGFRDAWRDDEGVVVDMEHARELFLDKVRRVRNRVLLDYDGAWMRATGQGDELGAAALENERQVLRDLPQSLDVDGAKTPAELSALWPADLPEEH